MRDGCCICLKTKWTLTINNLKCESYSWRSNFFKRDLFWSAFSLCCDWDQIELESKVDEGASIVQVTFWRAAFHGGCLQDSKTGKSLKKKSLFSSFRFNIVIYYALNLFLFLQTFYRLTTQIYSDWQAHTFVLRQCTYLNFERT